MLDVIVEHVGRVTHLLQRRAEEQLELAPVRHLLDLGIVGTLGGKTKPDAPFRR